MATFTQYRSRLSVGLPWLAGMGPVGTAGDGPAGAVLERKKSAKRKSVAGDQNAEKPKRSRKA